MLRGVKPVGQGGEGCVDGRGLRRLRQRLFGTEALAPLLLLGWVLSLPARSLHAAEPFPPGEASEHFDAQARAGKKDLMATLQADSRFQVMTRAMSAAGLSPMLHARGPLTLFVPTDAAFEKLTGGKLEQWLKQPSVLKSLLRYHILRAYVPSKQLSRLRNALTANGYVVQIDGGSGVKVNGVSIIESDLHASNGVIHVVDTVLVPPEGKSKAKPKRKGALKGEAAAESSEAEAKTQ